MGTISGEFRGEGSPDPDLYKISGLDIIDLYSVKQKFVLGTEFWDLEPPPPLLGPPLGTIIGPWLVTS